MLHHPCTYLGFCTSASFHSLHIHYNLVPNTHSLQRNTMRATQETTKTRTSMKAMTAEMLDKRTMCCAACMVDV